MDTVKGLLQQMERYHAFINLIEMFSQPESDIALMPYRLLKSQYTDDKLVLFLEHTKGGETKTYTIAVAPDKSLFVIDVFRAGIPIVINMRCEEQSLQNVVLRAVEFASLTK